jgi:hypothetical protein
MSFIILLFFSLSSLLAQTDQAGDQKQEESQVANTVIQAKKVGKARTVFQLRKVQAPADVKNANEKSQNSQTAQPAEPRELTQRELKKTAQIQQAQNRTVKATKRSSKTNE